jgi:hypothetical protein
VATAIIEDEPGTVAGGGAGTQQISLGTLSWDTCIPKTIWSKPTTWSGNAGGLGFNSSDPYAHQDWWLDGTVEIIWYNGFTEVRRESRVFKWINGATTSDTVTINYGSGTVANSCIDSVTLTRSSYTFTLSPSVPQESFSPPSATFQMAETITTNYKQGWFDQSLVTYTDVVIYNKYVVTNVYRGLRNLDFDLNGTTDFSQFQSAGDVKEVSWRIYRSHDGSPYGLAWEDCSGGGDGGDGGGSEGSSCPCSSSRKVVVCGGFSRGVVACAGSARRAALCAGSSRKACG